MIWKCLGQVRSWYHAPTPGISGCPRPRDTPPGTPPCPPRRLHQGQTSAGRIIKSHLPWQPVNLDVSAQRRFHLPPALFTCPMKNWGVPEIFARKFLHNCQNFRGVSKSIKNYIFWLENNLYLHYSHKGVIIRVKETICILQSWHTRENIRGRLPCNLSKCAVFNT